MIKIKQVYKFWWLWQVLLICLSCFFIILGVQLLIASYSLKEPFSFLMTFFASNFIILFSAALIVVFVYKIFAVYKRLKNEKEGDEILEQ